MEDQYGLAKYPQLGLANFYTNHDILRYKACIKIYVITVDITISVSVNCDKSSMEGIIHFRIKPQ